MHTKTQERQKVLLLQFWASTKWEFRPCLLIVDSSCTAVSAIAAAVHISNAPAAMLSLTNCLLRFLSCATAAGPAHPQPTTHPPTSDVIIQQLLPISTTHFLHHHHRHHHHPSPLLIRRKTEFRGEKNNSTLLCPVPKTHKTETRPPPQKKKLVDLRKHTTKLQSPTAIVEAVKQEFGAAAGACSRKKRR